MKKILYLMHVNWGWIKQRPHFLAEYLADYFSVHVCFSKQYKKANLTQNIDSSKLSLKELFRLPRFSPYSKLNSMLRRYQIQKLLPDYDLIWVTHPMFFPDILSAIKPNQKLIYDCMDDNISFPEVVSDNVLREKLSKYERGLINKCNIVFCSSNHLKNTLENRYNIKGKLFVVNNGISANLDNIETSIDSYDDRFNIYFNNKLIRLVYVGTISQWMDFDLIMDSLVKFKEIAYFFFGPCDAKLPKHERIYYMGPVEHNKLFFIMNHATALIMPFIVDDLIKSVNPVKIYEYILTCKPSLIVSYKESNNFEDFVYLYSDKGEYLNYIQLLIRDNLPLKKSTEEYKDFARSNTWKQRSEEILKLLRTI